MSFRNISDKAVWGTTGKGWDDWFVILDRWRMQEKGHTFVRQLLRDEYGLSRWWAKTIIKRYEWERGL